MQCPKCFEFLPKSFAPGSAKTCPECGAEIAIHMEVETIREEIQTVDSTIQQNIIEIAKGLSRTKSFLTSHLSSLQKRLDSLETRLNKAGPLPEKPSEEIEPMASRPKEEKTLTPQPAFAKPVDPLSKAIIESELPQPPSSSPPSPSYEESARPAGENGDYQQALRLADSMKKPRTPAPPPPADEFDFGFSEVGLGQKWLLIVGIAILVLGVAFFVKYAFDNNWITPAGRVALSYLLGIALMGVGEGFRRRNLEVFGLYLVGGAIATFYVSTFSAFQYYKIIGQVAAFGIMVLITVLASTLAVVYDNKWMAVLGLIGGFATPVLVSTGQDNQIALMSYMTVLNLGILGLSVFKRWNLLNYLGFFSTWILFSGWCARHYTPEKFWPGIFFNSVFFLIYAVLPFVEYLVQNPETPESQTPPDASSGKKSAVEFDITAFALTVPDALWSFGFSFSMIQEKAGQEYVSLVTLAYTFIFAGMASFIFQRNRKNLEPFVLLLSMSILSLILTVPILFSGHWITIFWAAQSIALLWASIRLSNQNLFGGAVLLLLVTALRFMAWDWSIFWLAPGSTFQRMLLERWITCVFVLAIILQFARMTREVTGNSDVANPIFGVFTLFLLIVLSFEDYSFFGYYAPQARNAGLSVLWSLYSIGMIIIGFIKRLSLVRKCAIGLFLLTILKVFLSDMENASTPFRIVSFMVLGFMLIGASFIYHRFKEQLLAAVENREAYR